MTIGFTGTQKGMTPAQMEWLRAAFAKVGGPFEFHHGDCVGADEQAHRIAREFIEEDSIKIHPPSNPIKRAFCAPTTIEPKPYLDRNKDIVRASAVLIGMPGEDAEQLRSGTWSTIRFARYLGRPLRVVRPVGELLQ